MTLVKRNALKNYKLSTNGIIETTAQKVDINNSLIYRFKMFRN